MGQTVYDGNLSFLGGQNAGLDASLIGETQYAKSVNTTIVKGLLRPRPGITEIPIKCLTEGGITQNNLSVRTYAEILRTGKFQGAAQLVSDEGLFIIATISGIIFKIDPANNTAVVLLIEDQTGALEPPSQRLNQYVDRHNSSVAGRYFVIADPPDYPLIFDGATVHRADPAKYEIPLPSANIFTFNQNRLFAFGFSEFTAGDPVGNQSTLNAPITFEEVFAPAAAYAGQSFSLGSSNLKRPITAAGYLEQIDSSTGIGPMWVSTSEFTYAFQTQLERVQWKDSTFGIRILSTVGVAGQRAAVNIGTDLWFMSGDGRIRSFSVARSDQNKWARTPLDQEVENWIRFCDKSLIQYTVAAHHNNRILFSVNPQLVTAKDLNGNDVLDICFKGMVAVELSPISGFLQGGTPCWAGLWTGVRPMEFIELNHEMYVFSKDPGNINVLYKLEYDDITWDTWQGKTKQIISRVEMKKYSCNPQGLLFALKEEVTVFPGLQNVAGKFCIQVDRRNDDFPKYAFWRSFIHEAPVEVCVVDPNEPIPDLLPHSFRELNFGDKKDDENECNPVTGEDMRYFNEAQFRITLTGLNWELTSFRIKAELQEDAQLITDKICKAESVQLKKDCTEVNDFDLYSTPFKDGVWVCQPTEC